MKDTEKESEVLKESLTRSEKINSIFADHEEQSRQRYHITQRHDYLNFQPMMKKGHKEVIDTINKYGGATWKELETESKKYHMSTATLSKRLKEGKEAGIIKEDIRHKNGKKIYKIKYEE